jgi:deoxyadenosine/deoxycytidine kinase
MSRARVVAVAGTMGAGKSSLVAWLNQHFGMVPYFEPNDENPYLSDFYSDMRRWAFSSQLFFLVRRFEIHRALDRRVAEGSASLVQDRTIYEDAEIFAAHHHAIGNIDARDWGMYQDLYRTFVREIRPPDLMIYLRCPVATLARRIRRRGRTFERAIPRSYLAALEALYEAWLASYALSPVLVIETSRSDYVEHLFDRLELIRALERHLH